MSFKKYLKIKIGQSTLEYFILFSIIAGLSILSLSSFYPKVRAAIQGTEEQEGLFQIAFKRLGDAVLKSNPTPVSPNPTGGGVIDDDHTRDPGTE